MTPPVRWLRRSLPLLALLVVAVGSWTTAGAADRDDADVEAVAYPLAPADPVLSARRLPRTLQAPLADLALRPQLDALVAASPDDSCLVVSVAGREVVGHNPRQPLVPASNQKLLTTWAALEVLGPEATFRTSARSEAPIVDGVLDGDLWLVGDGDPLLMTDPWVGQFDDADQVVRTRFEDLADALVAAGLTRVTGAVVGDESKYDAVRGVATWAPRLVEQSQAGPLSALLVDEGMESFPPVYVNRSSYVPSADPAVHAAQRLAGNLAERGVTIDQGVRAGAAPPTAAERAAIVSPPMTEVVRMVNAWSNNTAAELLVKAMDHAAGGEGSTAGGVAVMGRAMAEAGLPVEGVAAFDGSGLDEGDRVTCELIHALLDDAGDGSVLATSLPVAGVDGTLRNRFGGTPAEGLVQAKTGSLRGVSALSGFARSATEPDSVTTFAFVANAPGPEGIIDAGVVAQQEPFVAALATYPQAPAVTELGPRQPVAIG
jgi:serine-type D-Ala-D-Ala carboxypeptidase/endopeptidase (penicillin-binding protein 4)